MPYKADTVAFSGLLQWEDVEKLIDDVRNSGSKWHYVYTQLDDEKAEIDSGNAADFLKERMEEIKKIDKICGWFYVHTKENPSIIKIYHPRMSGGGCSLFTPPPWIIMSVEKPENIADLESYKPVIKPKKSGIFNKMFG
jgi:hypoxanthine phosphoribosyltransferase